MVESPTLAPCQGCLENNLRPKATGSHPLNTEVHTIRNKTIIPDRRLAREKRSNKPIRRAKTQSLSVVAVGGGWSGHHKDLSY